MRTENLWLAVAMVGALAFSTAGTPAYGAGDENGGGGGKFEDVIKKRQALMEQSGELAEDVNMAQDMSAEGVNLDIIGRVSTRLQANARKIPSLFPKGSTGPDSRAKADIWTNWAKFEDLAKKVEGDAAALVDAAQSGQDAMIYDMVKKLSADCKACHTEFRKPEDD